MEITQENLIEEYHLPGKPAQLKKRLAEIIRAMRRMYGKPAADSYLEKKVVFFENWKNSIIEPSPQPLPARTKGKKK